MRLSAEQLHRFDQDGFLVLPNAFTAEEIALLREPVPRLLAEATPQNPLEAGTGAVRNVMSLHHRDETYARLIRHPRLLEPAMQLSGERDLYAQQVKINPKLPFDGAGYDWHVDFATHHRRDGVPRPQALQFHLFLDDVTEFNGPIIFVPGSHKRDITMQKTYDGVKWELWTVPKDTVASVVQDLGMVSTKGPRGTLLIFSDKLLHVSAHNLSPWPRWIFSLVLNPVSNAATIPGPTIAHEHDRRPLRALGDDCLFNDMRCQAA